jgi:hypothetical protein
MSRANELIARCARCGFPLTSDEKRWGLELCVFHIATEDIWVVWRKEREAEAWERKK